MEDTVRRRRRGRRLSDSSTSSEGMDHYLDESGRRRKPKEPRLQGGDQRLVNFHNPNQTPCVNYGVQYQNTKAMYSNQIVGTMSQFNSDGRHQSSHKFNERNLPMYMPDHVPHNYSSHPHSFGYGQDPQEMNYYAGWNNVTVPGPSKNYFNPQYNPHMAPYQIYSSVVQSRRGIIPSQFRPKCLSPSLLEGLPNQVETQEYFCHIQSEADPDPSPVAGQNIFLPNPLYKPSRPARTSKPAPSHSVPTNSEDEVVVVGTMSKASRQADIVVIDLDSSDDDAVDVQQQQNIRNHPDVLAISDDSTTSELSNDQYKLDNPHRLVPQSVDTDDVIILPTPESREMSPDSSVVLEEPQSESINIVDSCTDMNKEDTVSTPPKDPLVKENDDTNDDFSSKPCNNDEQTVDDKLDNPHRIVPQSVDTDDVMILPTPESIEMSPDSSVVLEEPQYESTNIVDSCTDMNKENTVATPSKDPLVKENDDTNDDSKPCNNDEQTVDDKDCTDIDNEVSPAPMVIPPSPPSQSDLPTSNEGATTSDEITSSSCDTLKETIYHESNQPEKVEPKPSTEPTRHVYKCVPSLEKFAVGLANTELPVQEHECEHRYQRIHNILKNRRKHNEAAN